MIGFAQAMFTFSLTPWGTVFVTCLGWSGADLIFQAHYCREFLCVLQWGLTIVLLISCLVHLCFSEFECSFHIWANFSSISAGWVNTFIICLFPSSLLFFFIQPWGIFLRKKVCPKLDRDESMFLVTWLIWKIKKEYFLF